MKMVSHQTIGLDLPIAFRGSLTESLQKAAPVGVIFEDRLAAVAAIHDVINRAGIFQPEFSRHALENALVADVVNEEIHHYAGLTPFTTRRMTSASVWPPAQVAFSHSRICATLITGTGIRKTYAILRTTKRELRRKVSRGQRFLIVLIGDFHILHRGQSHSFFIFTDAHPYAAPPSIHFNYDFCPRIIL